MRLLQRSPNEIPPAELAAIERLIADADKVYPARLRENLPHAARIVTAHAGDRLVGASAVKQPPADYIEKIATRAAYPDLAGIRDEFGYSAVLPEFRRQGIGAAMLFECLRQQTVGAFATVDKLNAPMNLLMARHGFIRVGREWQGRRGTLCLWVRPP